MRNRRLSFFFFYRSCSGVYGKEGSVCACVGTPSTLAPVTLETMAVWVLGRDGFYFFFAGGGG